MASEQNRILVVDDDIYIVQFLKNALKDMYNVDTAHCLADALDLFDEHSYAVIVTDLNLAQESGMTLARYAREKDPYVEVIIVTGHASVESAREAIDLGVVSYLTKPIDLATLRMQVNRSVMSNRFNVRSKMYSVKSDAIPEQLRDHMTDILALYQFVTKLNQTVELAGTVQVLLKEISLLYRADLAILGVKCLGFEEIYSYSLTGMFCTEEEIRGSICEHWNSEVSGVGIDRDSVLNGLVPVEIVGETCSESVGSPTKAGKPFVIPLVSYGENFGFIALYRDAGSSSSNDHHEFYYAMAPLLAPPVYRGFIEKKMHEQAQTDGLTGIANRRALQEALARDIQRAVRYDRPLSVIIMDIDDFKKVNDTFGHLMGDEVLKDLTVAVKTVIRGSDFFGRYGGEEFVVILPDTEREGAAHLAERIREVIEKRVCISTGVSVDYRASVGVAVFTPENIVISDGVDWGVLETSLIGRADDALYMAKGKGKNCVVVAD